MMTVWVTVWGELHERDVPPELWAKMMAHPRRKDGNLDMRFRGAMEILDGMDAIARERFYMELAG